MDSAGDSRSRSLKLSCDKVLAAGVIRKSLFASQRCEASSANVENPEKICSMSTTIYHLPVFARLVFALVVCRGSVLGICQESLVRPAWTTSKLHGAPTPPAPYQIRLAFPRARFDKPTSLLEVPQQNRLIVSEMDGKLFSLAKSSDQSEPQMIADLSQITGVQVSLLSATLHPKFDQNRYIFLSYVHPDHGRQVRIARFTMSAGIPGTILPKSEVVFLTRPAGPHNAGDLKFGKDGLLYAATGDGAGPNPPDSLNTGQDVSDLLGAILRIDVDRANESLPYSIPLDNPFRGKAGVREEIWAYGLRNPWKFGIDRNTNEIFVADNGWETWELIHRIERGGNCGWPIMEGRARLRTEVTLGPTPIIPPIKDHPHTEANSVIGGPVYRGAQHGELQGAFIYGDYITGTIWAVWPESSVGTRTTGIRQATLVDTDLQIVAFAEGSRGEVYVLDYDFTGKIYELIPTNLQDQSASFPKKLSETGVFTSLVDLQPAPGVVPYSVVAQRWMDGAQAQRWIAIPDQNQATLTTSAQGSMFPTGTVLVKQIDLKPNGNGATKRLETQILHFENGVWQPYSYLWDEAGQDADLVDPTGGAKTIPSLDLDGHADTRTWRVNAVNECKLCHNAASNYVLGFVPQQLASTLTDTHGRQSDQLTRLVAQGVISATSDTQFAASSRLVDPHDSKQSLDDRARSYLHANCSMCHQPRGNAIVSFYLRREMPFDQLKTDKGTIIGTFGMNHAKVIAGGDPYRSILLYRMAKLGYGRMPYIGSQVVDGAGVALISEWIRSLPKLDSHLSEPLKAGTPMHQAVSAIGDRTGARDLAIHQLISSTEGALALLERIHSGRLSSSDRQNAVAATMNSPSDIAGLFETFMPERQRRVRLGPTPQPQQILSLKGDVARGQLIYFSDNARCRACHEHTDAKKSLGPTLTEISQKYVEPSEMLLHILEPSKKIDDRFLTVSVLTTNNQIVTGLIVAEDGSSVSIKTNELKVIQIPKREIEETRKSPKSLMPEAILSDLSPQEAADLLAYIHSLRK